jgi:hypothetical protein
MHAVMVNQYSCLSTEPRLFLEIIGYNFSKLSETALHESAFTGRWIALRRERFRLPSKTCLPLLE